MAKQNNIWKYYDDWKVHITDSKLMESVCQTFNLMNQIDTCTKYYDKSFSKPIGWDIIVSNTYINDVKKHIKDFS
jgi:hypothetical protein|tara:strand:- start:183 stop:407 length:225 start_codon:yes stop_codon:yes gene_type:complete